MGRLTLRRNSTFNILMYSHDTYGLGHIRRTMAIASQLRAPNINILILTGSPIAGRFRFPEQIDFVRIPGMIKKTNDEYRPLSIKIHPQHALNIRKSIITSTAKTFRPHLFIVDKEPLGLKKEVLPTLRWIQQHLPCSRTILGLRDIMDEAAVVKRDWEKKGVYEAIKSLYSEIWVYGERDFYDPTIEYEIPANVVNKVEFTGYIPRESLPKAFVTEKRKELGLRADEKLVVVTTGGGGDGYAVMDNFLTMLETDACPFPFKSILVTGPFMPKKERKQVFRRAHRLGIEVHQFYRHMSPLIAAADLAITMGGYNTLCEILTHGTVALVVPRETPRKEQLIRAQVFKQQKMVDYIPWQSFSPETLLEKVCDMLENPQPYQAAMARFQLTGLQTMRQRLAAFQND